MGADVARSVATPTISDACTVRLVEQVRGGKIVVGDHGTIGSSESRLRRCSRLSKDDATSDRRDVLATSEIGTNRTSWDVRSKVANGGKADMGWAAHFGSDWPGTDIRPERPV